MVGVLIAEDDRDTQEALSQALGDEGYAVSNAYDGPETLAKLRASTEPLVVLLDLYMGLIGGETVLRTVAEDPLLAARHRYIVVSAVPATSSAA